MCVREVDLFWAADDDFAGDAKEETVLDDAGGAFERLGCLLRGKAGFDELAVQDVVLAVGDVWLAVVVPAEFGHEALIAQAALGGLPAKGNDSTGTVKTEPSWSTTLRGSTATSIRRLAMATIFSRSSAPPWPLMSANVPRCTSSAPSMVRSSCGWRAKSVSGMPSDSAWRCDWMDVAIADDAKAVADAASDFIDDQR